MTFTPFSMDKSSAYAQELKQQGVIKCIGVSTHHSGIALEMAQSGVLDCMMLSVNPAYDLVPPSRMKISSLQRICSKARRVLTDSCKPLSRMPAAGYCHHNHETFAAGLLLHDKLSPFGKALTDYQCIRYALDRPSVTTAMLGDENRRRGWPAPRPTPKLLPKKRITHRSFGFLPNTAKSVPVYTAITVSPARPD